MNHIDAVSRIVYSYAELFDLGDLHGCAGLFSRAVLRVHGVDGALEGPDAVQQYLESTVELYDGIPETKHLVTNLIVDVDDDGRSASARSYYMALQARPELPLQPILAGRWHDHFERDDNEWWLTERLIHPDLTGDIRFHIRRTPG